MKKTLSSVAVASLLLLVGAGCAPLGTTPPETIPNPPETITPDDIDRPQEDDAVVAEFDLTAEVLGSNQVKFSWELPSGMEEPESFRLVRGPKVDPVYPGGYWYQLLGSKRETTWVSLPTGKQFFRICTFKDNACVAYSNSLEVDVK